jgi:hypothetical protein
MPSVVEAKGIAAKARIARIGAVIGKFNIVYSSSKNR